MTGTATGSRTATRLHELRDQGRAALVGYLPLGYPDVAGSVARRAGDGRGGRRRRRARACPTPTR